MSNFTHTCSAEAGTQSYMNCALCKAQGDAAIRLATETIVERLQRTFNETAKHVEQGARPSEAIPYDYDAHPDDCRCVSCNAWEDGYDRGLRDGSIPRPDYAQDAIARRLTILRADVTSPGLKDRAERARELEDLAQELRMHTAQKRSEG